MSEKPHTVAIGAFVVGAALIALTTTLLLIGAGIGEKEKVVMVFDGSVKGLNIGAPLALRGVQVGQVTKIDLILDADNVELIMLVEADFQTRNIRTEGAAEGSLTDELLARGLRAQLNTQSLLTGLLYIQLDFHPGTEMKLAEIDSPHIQIPTIPTDLERIARKLQSIDPAVLMDDLNTITTAIKALVDNEEFQSLPTSLTTTLDSLTRLSEQLQEQVASTGPRLDSVLDETNATVSNANAQLPGLSSRIEGSLDELESAIVTFNRSMAGIESVVAHDSNTLYQLNKALLETARAGRALQSLARTLEEQPEALLKGKTGDQ